MTVLRQRMTEDMQVRNLSPHTQASYLQQVSLFARYFRMSPDALTPEHIRTYQIYLTNEKRLAPNSIHTAVAALRFLYRITLKKDWTFGEDIPLPKKPQKLPVVLSPEEVVHFLSCVDCNKHRVILTTCYAAGLRISEAVRLKAAAIDSARMVVRVEQGKGRKDRYVMLSPMLLEILRSYWIAVRPKEWLFPGIHDDDGWPAKLGRRGHSPAHHSQLSLSASVAHNWGRVVGKHAWHRWQVADVSVHDPEQRDDRGLVRRDRVEIMPTSA